MLKYLTEGIAKRIDSREDETSRESLMRQLWAMMLKYPDFRRVDGILATLAESCLNPSEPGRDRVIGVCSAIKGEGKTTIAQGLATALARRSGREVLLLEGDLAEPTMAADLHYGPVVGLSDCLREGATAEESIRTTPVEHLSIMTAGSPVADPTSLLIRSNFRELLASLKTSFRHILIDMPPVLEREETGYMIEAVDSVVLVVEAGKVAKETTAAGVSAIGKNKVLGVVLNRVDSAAPGWVSRILSNESTVR